jgi:hypothetical protein
MAIGINSSNEGFDFSVSNAQPTTQSEEGEEEGDDYSPSSQGRSLIEAIHELNAKSSRELFLGQTKTVVFGTDLLKDNNAFKEAIGVLENLAEVDRMITVLATDSDIQEILNASPNREARHEAGYYVVNSYRLASKSGGHSFHQYLESMTADLRRTGNTLVPVIEESGQVAGAVLIRDFEMADKLNGTELRGLLWAESNACKGAILGDIPLIVRRHKSNFRFSEEDGHLRCFVDVKISGEVSRMWKEAPAALEYEQLIASEMEESIRKIQQDLKVDALHLQRALQRGQHALYQRYSQDWQHSFSEMEIIPLVRCKINLK